MISYNALLAARSRESGVLFVQLLTLEHSSLAEPLRFTNTGQDFTSRGNIYTHVAFDIGIPGDRAGGAGQPNELAFDNVGQQVTGTIRSIVGLPTVTHEIVTDVAPDDVESSWTFEWQSTRYDAHFIRGELTFDSVLNEQYPYQKHTPSNSPTLF